MCRLSRDSVTPLSSPSFFLFAAAAVAPLAAAPPVTPLVPLNICCKRMLSSLVGVGGRLSLLSAPAGGVGMKRVLVRTVTTSVLQDSFNMIAGLTPEQKDFHQAVRAFAEQEIAPIAHKIDKDNAMPLVLFLPCCLFPIALTDSLLIMPSSFDDHPLIGAVAQDGQPGNTRSHCSRSALLSSPSLLSPPPPFSHPFPLLLLLLLLTLLLILPFLCLN